MEMWLEDFDYEQGCEIEDLGFGTNIQDLGGGGLNHGDQGLDVKHREWEASENYKTIQYKKKKMKLTTVNLA